MEDKEDGSYGGAMPVEQQWVFGDGQKTLITVDPDTGRGHMVAKAPRHVLGREPHWGNCPDRKKFKAKKAQRSLFE